jgi:hypothetical protein
MKQPPSVDLDFKQKFSGGFLLRTFSLSCAIKQVVFKVVLHSLYELTVSLAVKKGDG